MDIRESLRYSLLEQELDESNPAKPAIKHMNKVIAELGTTIDLVSALNVPQAKSLHKRLNDITRELYGVMVPLSQIARAR